MRKLTVGMATHDDYDGVYFSIQNIRLNHPKVLKDLEFVIVDNNPNGEHGKSIRNLLKWIEEPVQYLPFTKYQSSTIKNKVFELADTPYVLCMDSHVMVAPDSLEKLIKFYDLKKDNGNLLHGPLLYDDMKNISTHFDMNIWSSHMWGQWASDERGKDPENDPFEIPAQGMGLFSCRKDSWLGFNKNFRGFGGEEGYIHEKFRKNGKSVLCLPFLRWLHRFERPNGATYPNKLEERFRNYYIGFKELNLNTEKLMEHFSDCIPKEYIVSLDREIEESKIP